MTTRVRTLVARFASCAAIVGALIVGDPSLIHAQPGSTSSVVEVVPQVGHADADGGALSPDGRLALTADSIDYRVQLWDVRSGRLLRILLDKVGYREYASQLAISSDDGYAIALAGGRLHVWDTATGFDHAESSKQPGAFGRTTGDDPGPSAFAIAPDSRSLYLVRDGLTKVSLPGGLTSTTFERVGEIGSKLVVAANGRVVGAPTGSGGTTFWDTGSGRVIRTITSPVYSRDRFALSADGEKVAFLTTTSTIELVDVRSGRSEGTLRAPSSSLTAITFVRDGSIVVQSEAGVHLWRPGTKAFAPLKFPQDDSVLAIAPDGLNALTASRSTGPRVVDLQTGAVIHPFEGDLGRVTKAEPSRRGRKWITSGEGVPEVVDSVTGKSVVLGNGEPADTDPPVALAPGGDWALTAGDEGLVTLWDARVGKIVKSLTGVNARVVAVALSAKENRAAAGTEDGDVFVWSTVNGKLLRTFKGTRREIRTLAFTPDERRVIAGTDDNRVRIWDLESGRELQNLRMLVGPVTALAVSPDGRLVAAGSLPFVVKVWDVASGKLIAKLETDDPGDRDSLVSSLAFSENEPQTITAAYGNHLAVWSLPGGRLVRSFAGRGLSVASIALPEEPDRLLTMDEIGAIAHWDERAGERLAVTHFVPDKITLTPEGFFDGSREAAKLLTVVRGLEVYSIDQVYDQLYRPDLVREKLAGDPKGLVKAAAAKIDLDKAIGSGAPPTVTFVGAPPNVAAETVRLEVELTDRGGGIGKVEWRVNGVVAGLGNRGVVRVDATPGLPSGSAASGRTQRLTQELTLVPGENTVEVVAYNARGLVASRPETVKIGSSATAGRGPGRLFVLAIGINDYYDSRLALNYAVPDAKAIIDGFRASKGSIYDTVETTLVADADATPQKIEAALAEIGAKARPRDTFVLFVAGHGKTVDGRYYYLPRDFRYRDETSFATSGIGQAQFQDWLSRVKAQRSVLLFDTCESGSLTDERSTLRGVERAVAMEKMTAAMGRTTIAAASDDKPALEGYRGHGVFTYAILEGLSAADRNGDGSVDVLELIQHLDSEVPLLSDRAFKFRQIPQAKFSGNNFALAAKTAVVPGSPQTVATPAIPSRPTHVLIAPSDVLATAGTGATVARLDAGTQVSVTKTEAGWVLIVRDGRPLGYVREAQVLRLQ